jgi:hypothetical protein
MSEQEKLIIEIMEYIYEEGNKRGPDTYALATEIIAHFMPYTRNEKEELKYRREIQDILKSLRTLELAEMQYVPYEDYRGIPWLRQAGYRLTKKGIEYLKILKEKRT